MKMSTFAIGMFLRSMILTAGFILKILHYPYSQSFIIVGIVSMVFLGAKFAFLEYRSQKK